MISVDRNKLLSIIVMILLLITVGFANIQLDTMKKGNNDKIENALSKIDVNDRDKYTTDTHENSKFSSHLPLVLIETNGQVIIKDEVVWSVVTVIDNQDGMNYLGDKNNFQTASTIKIKGSSSAMFDKKQYNLEFFKEKEGTKKNTLAVMGMSKDEDWILNGPFLDRSLIRNSLLYGVSREILDWAPDTRYCEVFLDGIYKGLYLMVESVKINDSRINLIDFALINGQTPYMLQRERAGTRDNVITSYGTYAGKTYHELSIRYPADHNLLEKQEKWIIKDISEFERLLYSDDFDNPKKGYSKYIDMDSFVDYYIINEFAMIIDAGFLSTIVYKDLGGKLKTTVWDFNNAFDNYPSRAITSNEFCVENNNWYDRLLQDRKFTEKVVKRYHELRKSMLSDEYLLKTIDDTVLFLGAAVDRNFDVWGYTLNKTFLLKDKERISRDPKSYDEAISMLKDEIINRGIFLDENIEILYQKVIN